MNLTDYQEGLITYIMCNSIMNRDEAIKYCEKHKENWSEI